MQSAWYKSSLAQEELHEALKRKNEKELAEVLEKVVPLSDHWYEDSVREMIVYCQWPGGFDKVVEALKINPLQHKRADRFPPIVFSMVDKALEMDQWWLVEHLWEKEDPEVQNRLISSNLSTKLAVLLVKKGQIDKIRKLKADSRELLSECLDSLSRSNSEEEKGCLKEVVKTLLKEQRPWVNVELWRTVCRVDSVSLLKELIDSEVIKEWNLTTYCPLVSMISSSDTVRLSEDYAVHASQGVLFTQKAKASQNYTAPEMICLFSEGEHKVLFTLLGNEDFRKDLMESALARQSFIMLCTEKGRGEKEALVEELARGGTPMETLLGEDANNILHALAGEPEREETKSSEHEKFMSLVKLYPGWLDQKNFFGSTPLEVLKAAGKEELVSKVEAWVLSSEVRERKRGQISKPESTGKSFRV